MLDDYQSEPLSMVVKSARFSVLFSLFIVDEIITEFSAIMTELELIYLSS